MECQCCGKQMIDISYWIMSHWKEFIKGHVDSPTPIEMEHTLQQVKLFDCVSCHNQRYVDRKTGLIVG